MTAYLIIIFAFVIQIADKYILKADVERIWIFKKSHLNIIMLILLASLFFFQILDSNKKNAKEVRNDNLSNNTNQTANATLTKIDTVKQNTEKGIKYTMELNESINGLNKQLEKVRTNIEKSINEYKGINDKYEEQLKIEKEKIIESKPDLRIISPIAIIDSNSFGYQFVFSNNGKRIADTIKYYSAMIFIDSTKLIVKLDLIRTNIYDYNVTSIPPNPDYNYYISSDHISKTELKKYAVGILIVRYRYKDDMTGILQEPQIKAFICPSIIKNRQQFGQNVPNDYVSKIKIFLRLDPNYKDSYDYFFNDY